jgi:tetratricopeptide (TPR) repeat protein
MTVAVYVAMVALLVLYRRKIDKRLAFFALWPLIDFFPVSQIVSSIGTMPGHIALNEHFLYLPSVGIFTLIVIGVRALSRRIQEKRVMSAGLFRFLTGAVLVAWTVVTVEQVLYASNEVAMFRRSLVYAPENTRVRNSLALAYTKRKLYPAAEAEFRRVIAEDMNDQTAWIGVAQSLCDQGRYEEGVAVYEKLRLASPDSELIKNNIAKEYRKYFDILKVNVKKDKDNAALHFEIGVIYSRLDYLDDAVRAFDNTLQLSPDHQGAFVELGDVYAKKAEWEHAIAYYGQALAVTDNADAGSVGLSVRAMNGLRAVYTRLGRPDIAEEIIKKAVNRR